MASRKEWFLRLVLVAVSMVIGLLAAEVMARIVYPISDGRDNVTLDGVPVQSFFEPGSVYRQVSNEYDARTTIAAKGHRVPGTDGNPDVVFIGDSFTYGWGIEDPDTFVSIYCTKMARPCANLGMPGTGTAKQLNRLEDFLDRYQWHPKEVKLIFFGMSGAWSAGNDFVDNYDERGLVSGASLSTTSPTNAAAETTPALPLTNKPAARPRIRLAERIIGMQTFVMGHSNLVRLAKFYWGPMLKSLIVADPGQERLSQALRLTEANLKRLDEMSRARGFDYSIYLIVPVQDVIRRSYPQTLAALNGVAKKPVISTAPLFVDDPASYYFAFDGHVNVKGSRRIGEFLVAREQGGQTTPSQVVR